MGFHRPSCGSQRSVANASAMTVLMLLSLAGVPACAEPASPAPAVTAAVSSPTPVSVGAVATASPPAAPVSQSSSPPDSLNSKSLTEKAVEKVKQVAKSAGDIFNRVPCLAPKDSARSKGSLPHVAGKLAAGQPVVIIAFGSSSTVGVGSTAPEYTYPNRLAAQLQRQYPGADITVVNRGRNGEDAPEMLKRLQSAVLDLHPDLVIWQVGTNAVLRKLDPDETGHLVDEGVAQIQAAGADLVLVDPQYSPRVTERADDANKMVKLLGKIAQIRHVNVFPRFSVMRDWHEKQAVPMDTFVVADGLHMTDWGYACFAQLLGDDIIKSVGQIKLGVSIPSRVEFYLPM